MEIFFIWHDNMYAYTQWIIKDNGFVSPVDMTLSLTVASDLCKGSCACRGVEGYGFQGPSQATGKDTWQA